MAVNPNIRNAKLYKRLLNRLGRRTIHRRIVRWGLVCSNLLILIATATFILSNQNSSRTVNASSLGGVPGSVTAVNPLDQLASADVAVTVARLDRLPEATAITNQAESEQAELAITSATSTVAIKPQVVATAFKSRADIQNYTTKPGDSLTSLAAKFGVTSDSIRWSNNIASNNLVANQKLVIPPVNGIVYVVKAGDTPDNLASRFSSNKDQIIAINDAEISGLKVGEQIIIPNGTIVQISAPSFYALYGSNGYDWGYCTWYVATQIAVPSNWGNANTWAYFAALSGWTVSSAPRVGAIAQTSAGWEGHVAIVSAVSSDGSMIKYNDMNNYGDGGGFDRVGHSGWVPAYLFEHYIYH
ncbi:MAG TPA: LysM peptidoglycan-binding domain-containing protein [Candidatus Dormibacteraeota bacterium]|nr:LysM peptidoglycan-binding domain-containing protein [Candidatus Dormibacteraeota bacterium]